jgi:LPS sulfotransferase NodH
MIKSQAFAAYVLCGTPRSGSTLLCEMLAATGVAGRPNSYFRREDVHKWAEAWRVPHPDGIDGPGFDCAYLAAMRREGRGGTGVFGLRLMWSSVAEASKRLNRALGPDRDIARSIEAAFGRTLFIHVSRRDTLAQAVSLTRAEQSGLWHLAADGTVLEGVEAARPTCYDRARIAKLAESLERDEELWHAFFEERGIMPLRIVHETVTADPSAAIRHILVALGLGPAAARSMPVPTAKMANNESRLWIERFRQESGP